MNPAIPLLMGLFSTLPKEDRPMVVPSHKIESKREEQQLSKRRLGRIKGKRARKNRGNNR